MMPLVSLLIDLSMAGLLLAVIVYCSKLNRSIRVLQDSKSELTKLFAEFDQSIISAQESVRTLRESAKDTESLLKEKLDTANSIADDLAFMIERGNKMADQLETGIKGGRPPAAKAEAPPPAGKPAPAASGGAFAGRTEIKDSGNSSRTASIESVLEQIANRNNPGAKPGGAKTGESKPHSRIRSKAEQELFDSLKSSR